MNIVFKFEDQERTINIDLCQSDQEIKELVAEAFDFDIDAFNLDFNIKESSAYDEVYLTPSAEIQLKMLDVDPDNALFHDDIEIVKLGTRCKNKPKSYKTTPLINATCNNNIDIVKLLLDSGEDIDATDFEDKTAFYYACEYEFKDIKDLLLNNGQSYRGDAYIGKCSISIGANSGLKHTEDNSIIINASGSSLNSFKSGLFIAPINEHKEETDDPPAGFRRLAYNPSTCEVIYY